MIPTSLLVDIYGRNFGMLRMTIEDFSDADMLVRPFPTANHAMWQLGHLFCSEASMIAGAAPEKAYTLSPEFIAQFAKTTSTENDPAKFPSKAKLLEVAEQVRKASTAWVQSLTASDSDKPSPEKIRPYAPTIGHLAHLIPDHLTMHLGQLQVIRRVLGKKVLF